MSPQCNAWAFDGERANSKSMGCRGHSPCPLQRKACWGAMQPRKVVRERAKTQVRRCSLQHHS